MPVRVARSLTHHDTHFLCSLDSSSNGVSTLLNPQASRHLLRPHLPIHVSKSISTTASAAMRYHIFMADRNDPNDKGPLPSIHIKDFDDSFTVTRAFPGFGKEIVKVVVDVEKNTVNIKLRDCDGCETLVPLPEGCKSGEARAEVKHGMVTVVVPKRKKGAE